MKTTTTANMPIYKVSMAAQHVVSSVRRDQEQFTTFNYNVTERTDVIERLITDFNAVKSNVWYLAVINEKSNRINQLRQDLHNTMRAFQSVALTSAISAAYNSRLLNLSIYGNMSAEKLLSRANALLSAVDGYVQSGQISQTGAALAASIHNHITELYTLVNEQNALYHERSAAAQTRKQIVAKIYNELKTISILGKAIWFTLDKVKFNDYVLTNFTKAVSYQTNPNPEEDTGPEFETNLEAA